ncbi:ABC transporter permease/substrate-binding protein [Flexithrix dorotheae]|uniref:ABC transporter permease/substrate-binding protein n=1 Tax=Flexithrix dorotheae TaxID=70993 RepID=UPI0003A0A0AA|nr:ABC transporter permease/substrate-binding protein [Flexithrix dorotheae]
MNEFRQFVMTHQQEIAQRTFEHIWLTLISLILAVIIGMLTGIALRFERKFASSVIGFIGVFQTIPSLALLGFLIPLVGIGPVPAIIALFMYALLPIVRNTYTGLTEVGDELIEAGTGMGMSKFQLLTKVEIPLALPTIFAGIRTATVINVGVATLCALIAAGGLGEFIFTGIALNNVQMILTGAIPSALLALFFDFILGLIQKHIQKILRPILIIGVILSIFLMGRIFFSPTKADQLTIGLEPEFTEREDGWKKLTQVYDLKINTVQLNPGLMYMAIKNKEVDVISGYSTDGRIKAYDLKVLEDDKNFFPPYFAAPLVKASTLEKFPELKEILNKLEGKIDNQTMLQLNFQVDNGKIPAKQVAKAFLDSLGFKTSVQRTGPPDLVIGSKNFSEQFILTEIFALLIENYSLLKVEQKSGLGGTKICFDALMAGEIDIYPEYTGTGLYVLLKPTEQEQKTLEGDAGKIYDFVKRKFKENYELQWLGPFGFNNTYALMMRSSQADSLKIKTISNLADYMKKATPN